MKLLLKSLFARGSEHFFYVGATLIASGVHFFYSVYVKANIEPLEFGIYSTCLLLQTYFAYIQLGSLNAFNRDYPQLIGSGDLDKAKKYRDSTFTYLVLIFFASSVVISVIIMLFGYIYGMDQRYIFGFVFCAFITAFNTLENFLSSRVRIDGGFKFVSIVIIIELIAYVVGFVIIYWIGYYTLYIVTLGSAFIGIIMYYKRGISDISFHMDFGLVKSIIISGLPLLINNLIWSVVDSIDKFVILGFMDAERLGVYSIAQMAFSYMVLIPTAMSQLFYVNLGKTYGASKSKKVLNDNAIRYTLIIALVTSFLILVAYYFIEPLVELVMPQYIGGVKSAQILMLALAIYTPTMVNGNILTILKKNAALLRGSIYLCILNIFCSIGCVLLLGAKIESVALGTAISYLLRTIILIVQLKIEAEANVMEMIKASIIPVLLVAGPGIIIYHLDIGIWSGFAISVCFSAIVLMIFYRKNVFKLIRDWKK